MKLRIFLTTLPLWILGAIFANSALSDLVYDSSKSYSAGDAVIPSSTDFTLYTAKITVPAGSNGPPNSTYWLTAEEKSTELANTHADTVSTPPSSDSIDTSEISNLGTPDAVDTASGSISASNEAFVMQQYLDFLGRDGDARGISYWANLIANGTIFRADVIDFFVSSAEFQAVIAPVSRLYLAYFKRLPDTDGLNHWIQLKLNGMALNDMSQHFSDSTEFQSTYGNLSNEDFVKLVYQNVLGREADAGGLNYWTGLLDGGTLNRGSVMTEFSESAENTNLTNNNIRVISFYYGMLGRAPDLDGYNYWVQQFENGVAANALLNAFYLGTEYQGRANVSTG